MKHFAITGVAGYIAPRHLQAINDTGNRLVAALDPNDSVGILDRYSQDVAFFTEFERFDRHLERLKRSPDRKEVDYLTICTPNYLHDAHIRLALRLGCSAICEKPLVATPWQLDALAELEAESPGRIYNVLQLRVHESIIELKKKLDAQKPEKKYQVELTYITSRGPWYHYSWKGNTDKSGGIATNIGIHFFDMLSWLFGEVEHSELYLSEPKKMSGLLELKNAEVRWFLSIDRNDLPAEVAEKGQTTYRSINYDGEEIEFSGGFTDLHTRVYEDILAGGGFGVEIARPSIELVHNIRNSPVLTNRKHPHRFLIT
ncbi:MAG: Gfo/Idh/MocA family oxidoreductase [Bacteroidetes bacterium]|nr:Gfo/Idh/MocA family oxidoreductase [Bacteroidota bacterium]